ncbi:SAM-dependent methyltransferase [Pararhodospirillum oryzae]|uniref:SAM-dependent methyltransferase n=1 Tax=Pararhodospirillum oryzae TaxID=478448 RepID=A0A512H861_9PROT|nr:SAM-dependent methyltransferase [Pararhodospirillum oryzae]
MSSPSDPMSVFDRALVRRHRERAAPAFDAHDFLFVEAAERLVERLDDIVRPFPVALDLGCHAGAVGQALERTGLRARKGIETLVQADLAPALARRAARALPDVPTFVADEEWLPLRPASLDLVLSALSLHWVNDLPGVLVQLRRALRPGGVLLASLLGGETLVELRACLAEAELAVEGGVSPRCSPLAAVRDVGDLLVRAGFALPTVDAEAIPVHYAEPVRLLADLRGMGESNAVAARRRVPLRRETLARALELYNARHATPEGRVVATFEVITLIAWAPG